MIPTRKRNPGYGMALPVKTKGMVNHKSDTSTKKAPSTMPL